MWETNTFAASFHARLNVAAFAAFWSEPAVPGPLYGAWEGMA